MAWFKFGKQDDSVSTRQAPTESVEAMRKRALMRLIGSAVLVLAAVIGLPMLFDSQPRSVAVDMPIDIPDKAKVKPLPMPSGAPVASQPAPAAKVDDGASLSGKEEIVSANTPATPAATPPKPASTAAIVAGAAAVGAVAAGVMAGSGKDDAQKAADKAKADKAAADKLAAEKAKKAAADKASADKANADKANAEKTATDKAATDKAAKEKAAKEKAEKDKAAKARSDLEASRAKALLDGKPAEAKPAASAAPVPASAAAGEGRFIVQFGAFTDAAKSREVRQKVEKAGLKTYSQVAKNAEGKDLIRVRVGPFASKAEAEKAAAKIKALDLPASILTL